MYSPALNKRFSENPKQLGVFACIVGLGLMCKAVYSDFIEPNKIKEWRTYTVTSVQLIETEDHQGSRYKYFRYVNDDQPELKSSKLITKIVDFDGLSQLSYPTQMELYSTHKIHDPLIGDELVWIEGVRSSDGIVYLDPYQAAAVINKDNKGFYPFGLVFFLIGLGLYFFATPKEEE